MATHLNGDDVVAGPLWLIASATTIGYTDTGAALDAPQEYDEITSNESGEVPVAIYPRPRKRTLMVNMMEISAKHLQLLCPDITATTTGIQFLGANENTPLVEFANLEIRRYNKAGELVSAKLPAMVAKPRNFKFLGERGDKWLVDAVFEGLHVPSGVAMTFSNVT